MIKMAAIFSLMFAVSCVWCACDSCGSECARACGTRRFRPCCFNYLRKKRGTDGFKVLHSLTQDIKESQPKSEVPIFVVENVPMLKQWTSYESPSENHPYSLEDMFENSSD